MSQHDQVSRAEPQGKIPAAIAATAPIHPSPPRGAPGAEPPPAGPAPPPPNQQPPLAATAPLHAALAAEQRAAGKKWAPTLPEARWSLREHQDAQHWVCLDRDTPYEAVFEPQFWANIARKFKRSGETIRLINDQRTIFAELIVLEFGPNWARVGEWHKKTVDQLIQAAPSAGDAMQYRVEDGGPIDRWRIIRLSDQAVVAKGLENQPSAYSYLANMLQRMGRR